MRTKKENLALRSREKVPVGTSFGMTSVKRRSGEVSKTEVKEQMRRRKRISPWLPGPRVRERR